MWFIGVEVEQETSAPLPKKNPGSAPAKGSYLPGYWQLLQLLQFITAGSKINSCN